MECPPTTVRLREILSAQDPSFEQAICLYEMSFPVDEREPTAEVRQSIDSLMISRPDQASIRHLFVAEQVGEVIGMQIHDYFLGVGLAWLVYLAVDPRWRRSGLGSRLFRCSLASCRLDALLNQDEFRGEILEVERVEGAETESQLEERRNRIRFFERLGVQKLTGTYVQPSLAEWLKPVDLNLFIAGVERPLDLQQRKGCVYDFMVRMWGIQAEDESVRRAMRGV